MILYLIRHTSVDVPPGVCYGQTDVPLKPSFEAEAGETAKQLEGLVFDRVYTSPLSRCVRLAAFCGYADALRDDRLKEIHFGAWEMQPFDAITDPHLQTWYADYLHVRATQGESFEDLFHRVSLFLDELRKQPYSQVAIFAHGGVLISAQIYAGVLKAEEAMGALTPYGGVIRVEI